MLPYLENYCTEMHFGRRIQENRVTVIQNIINDKYFFFITKFGLHVNKLSDYSTL